MKTLIEKNDTSQAIGKFTMRKHRKGDIKWHRDENGRVVVDKASLKRAMGKPLYEHPAVQNKVVSGAGGYGRNLIIRQLAGDTTYGIAIDNAKIGTGTTAPTDGDTDIETGVLTTIQVALFEVINDEVIVSFFIPDTDLADGTYTEFTMDIGGRLFARALITPNFSKSTNEDTTVEYTITLT